MVTFQRFKVTISERLPETPNAALRFHFLNYFLHNKLAELSLLSELRRSYFQAQVCMMYEIFSACGKKLPVNWLVGGKERLRGTTTAAGGAGGGVGRRGVFTMRVNILLCGNTVSKNSESTFHFCLRGPVDQTHQNQSSATVSITEEKPPLHFSSSASYPVMEIIMGFWCFQQNMGSCGEHG